MAGSTFQTNPFDLHKLLDDCQRGFFSYPISSVVGFGTKIA